MSDTIVHTNRKGLPRAANNKNRAFIDWVSLLENTSHPGRVDLGLSIGFGRTGCHRQAALLEGNGASYRSSSALWRALNFFYRFLKVYYLRTMSNATFQVNVKNKVGGTIQEYKFGDTVNYPSSPIMTRSTPFSALFSCIKAYWGIPADKIITLIDQRTKEKFLETQLTAHTLNDSSLCEKTPPTLQIFLVEPGSQV